MALRDRCRRGNTFIEFTLVGIPLIFVLISVFELSRGMWLYHTLAYAMRDGVRFAIVRGNNCNVAPNNCAVTIREIAQKIRDGAVGFLPTDIQNVVFVSAAGGPSPARVVTCDTLNDCLQPGALGDNYWPAYGPGLGDAPGADRVSRIEISAIFAFRSALAMFWPGAGPGQNFGTIWLPASSIERIQY